MKLNNFAITLATIGVATALLASCTPSPEKLNTNETVDYVRNIKYQKDDRTGLCFAFLLTSRIGTNNMNESLTMTEVPCEPLERSGLIAASAPLPTAEQNPMVDPLTGTAHKEVGMADP